MSKNLVSVFFSVKSACTPYFHWEVFYGAFAPRIDLISFSIAAAEVLGITEGSAKHYWIHARTWLYQEIKAARNG